MTRTQGTTYWIAIKEWATVLFLGTLFVSLCWLTGGCAETQADFTQHKFFRDPDTGLVVYEKTTNTGAFTRASSNAAAPTTQSVGETGVHASISGVHATTPEQIIAQNQRVLMWIGPGFMGAGVLAIVFLKNKPLGIGLGIVGAVCLGTPMFLSELGPYVVPLVGLGILAALTVWYLAQRHASNQSSKMAAARLIEADKLGQQGKYTEALDLMRSGIDVLAVNKPIFAQELKKQ